MIVEINVEVREKEPRFVLRSTALPKERYVAAGNPRAAGRQLMKLIERVAADATNQKEND